MAGSLHSFKSTRPRRTDVTAGATVANAVCRVGASASFSTVSQDTNHTGRRNECRLTMWSGKLSLKAQQEQPVEVESRRWPRRCTVGGGRRHGIVRLPFAIKLVGVVVSAAFVSCASTATQATQAEKPKVARTTNNQQPTTATTDKTLQITLILVIFDR